MTVAGVILAAGLSSRMPDGNKLLQDLHGKPVIWHAVKTFTNQNKFRLSPVLIVTGPEQEAVAMSVNDLPVETVHNPDFASGMASSIRTGIASLPEDSEGVLIGLGDMPLVKPEDLQALLNAFQAGGRQAICVPVWNGQRGNPVLWPQAFFGQLTGLDGDTGARALLKDFADRIVEVPVATPGITLDADTPEALDHIRSVSAP